ncbi:MAG TPA: RNA polymerase sigma factor [Tepidisphaeraceae bacterium]|jgi:RNA polymerase sigma-70 factor (ECF subfamily)|nr:RNA polymerase sigma factor [Tepidisphaeraceae bacterium]
MNVDSLDSLLEKLNSGDRDAAEQAFLTYEPYLRKVVRRLLPAELRAKFDSIDVVQSIYCDVFAAFREGGMRFGTVSQLRAFLIKATRNRFIDRVRQYQSAARLERPMIEKQRPPPALAREPHPSESAVAHELWERLLELCPPEHHQLLFLRRRGASASEIAKHVGMHEGSVRRVLRELSVRLACASALPEVLR